VHFVRRTRTLAVRKMHEKEVEARLDSGKRGGSLAKGWELVWHFLRAVLSLVLTIVFTAIAIPYALVNLFIAVVEWLVDEIQMRRK
jgi:hypothetical protein